MALADADERCKAAVLSLSIEPAPTLHDMLQVCARKIPFIKAHQNHSSKVKLPQKAAATDTVLPVPVPQPPPKRRTTCLLWDQAGHLASQCPLNRQFLDFRDNGGRRSKRSKRNFSKKLENVNVKQNNPALTSSAFQQKSPDMIVKDPVTRETKRPHDLITWGRGSPELPHAGDCDVINTVNEADQTLWTLKGLLQSEKAGGSGQRLPRHDHSGEESEDGSMESGESKLLGNQLRKKYAYAAVGTPEKTVLAAKISEPGSPEKVALI
ncbi:hypothetical protein DUI87_00800 [Hirundo rustica rustica]|uniref:Uncharacterized protein n=1 Tax=Hirundo rustica rustica TaxID=333673 RepID=A0A3M0L3H3_HIRRU|nr:hypothetical protein DUI87_03082 [Hirundo rustica rustica]RMC19955.1 hypothetical protein DUI87_00800 [Hirundo rustica rustica]